MHSSFLSSARGFYAWASLDEHHTRTGLGSVVGGYIMDSYGTASMRSHARFSPFPLFLPENYSARYFSDA
jgi:hypothetical protein